MSKKHIIYNDDGWSSFMRYPAPMSPEDIIQVTLGPVVGTAVKVFQFTALGGHVVNYNSKFLPQVGQTMDQVATMHVWRIRETLRYLKTLNTDPLRIVSEACHRHNLECQFSLRMNDAHHIYRLNDGSWYFPELQSPWFDEHPEALLPNRQLNYESPVVHEYRIRQIQEILDNYDVDGIDLDFTRFSPWFQVGSEDKGHSLMTQLVRELRNLTSARKKTLSARLEYDPDKCIASGLDLETWFAEGLFDQITLGGVGDHTPSASSEWFISRAHAKGCNVYPGIEGHLHWCPGSGAGGPGIHPGNGVNDGFGPPSIEYMRAVASMHYRNGADGVSLFNFTCADGPFSLAALKELGDPENLEGKDKQYVVAVWPWDAQIYQGPWTSQYRLSPGEKIVSTSIELGDNFEKNPVSSALLTLDLMGINHLDDFECLFNGVRVTWNGYFFNHYDHGCWNDTLAFTVPVVALKSGSNLIEIRRIKENPDFTGAMEVRKCILDIRFPQTFAPGMIIKP
jgi:hypothetical protein